MEVLGLGETLPGELLNFLSRVRRNRLRLQLDVVAIEDLVRATAFYMSLAREFVGS